MKRFIKPAITIIVLILIIAVVALLMLRYEVEGEENMPFNLSRIMVISSAEGVQQEGSENIWDLDIIQNNDIYLEITKNEEYKKKELIDSITLDNFIIEEEPLKGEMVILKPTGIINGLYKVTEANQIKDQIKYIGSQETDISNLEIANQGGRIQFRYTNQNLGKYTSNEQEEIIHDGTILQKINIGSKELKAKVSFDITIKLVSEKQYKATVSLELPTGDVANEGTTSFEKTDMKDIIFKRI